MEAVDLGNISVDELKEGIRSLVELASWTDMLPPDMEIDMQIGEPIEPAYSEWIVKQMNSIEEGRSGPEKRRRLEMLKLIDKWTIGYLETENELDISEFIWEFERELIRHKGRSYKKFVRWNDKTRLKELLSVNLLKKIWKYFGRPRVKFKKKEEFIKMTAIHLH
jgi:hypothetical protein